jgi:hypothetical protein
MKKYKYDTSYKISADMDFFYKVYIDNGIFEYIDISIAICKTGGFSSKNVELSFREGLRFRGESIYSLYNIYRLYKIRMKIKLRNILPRDFYLFLVRIKHKMAY